MTTLVVHSNTIPLIDNTPSIVTGKSGFATELGRVRLVCSGVAVGYNNNFEDGIVNFTVRDLNLVQDTNFGANLLDALASVSGIDETVNRISFPVLTQERFYNLPIEWYSVSSSTIGIVNDSVGDQTLFDIIPDPPFYIELNQALYTNHFSDRSVFVLGSSFTHTMTNTIPNVTSFTQPLLTSTRFKENLTVKLDGIEVAEDRYSFVNSSNSSILITGINNESYLQVDTKYYKPPAIEVGDNVQIYSGNVYSIVDTSYISDSTSYDASLTSAEIYKVKFATDLQSNIASLSAINISPDPIGTINNVSGRTYTFDYDNTIFPNTNKLATNRLYIQHVNPIFEGIDLPKDRIIRDVEPGHYVIRARNVNSAGRASPPVTTSITIPDFIFKKVNEISITETLYREQTVGAAVRITVTFPHIIEEPVTDYELSYKLVGEAQDLTLFNTVELPASGVDENGDITYTINNVNRGTASEVNSIVVRVTPLNGYIRGITSEATKTIVGKTEPPQNIKNLTFGQLGNNVHLFWEYETLANGELVDVDLRDVIIKRSPGEVTSGNFEQVFATAPVYVIVSAGSTRKVSAVDTFGTFTYLAKTRDTSGNLSTTTVGVVGRSISLASLNILQTYSEDDPTGNVVVGIPNTNRAESNYPSFSTSTGFSVRSGLPTDLFSSGSQSIYETSVRDLGRIGAVSLTANISGQVDIVTSLNEFRTNFLSGVSDTSTDTSILRDVNLGNQGIGTILGFNNTVAAPVSYSSENETLVSGGQSGNVWAIWNDGQFTDDTANANSFSLIAGVIDSASIRLGEYFHANGRSSSGNAFSNLTTSAGSYKLVNLLQFSDSEGRQNFLGDATPLTFSTELRTGTTPTLSEYTNFSTGTRNLRYFQIKHTVNNNEPDRITYTLDKFEYTVGADNKQFKRRVTYTGTDTGNTTYVNYSTTNFIDTPTISITIVSATNLSRVPIPVIVSSDITGTSFRVVYADNGANALNTVVDLIAIGA